VGGVAAAPPAAPEILALAAELLGERSPEACAQLSARAVWELLDLGLCELAAARSDTPATGTTQSSGR
jgi:hypothetical protein